MIKPKIYTVTQSGKRMGKTFEKQGYTNVVFNALFYRNGKKLNSIENASIANFSTLVRNYDKAENPDKVKIEFKNQDDNVLIWSKVYDLNDSLDDIPKSLSGYAGLGEAEVNDLVQRKFSEMERSKELERLSAELTKTIAMNEELQYQVLDMQASLDAKKQIEYYSSVIGMALPGLAKFLTGTPVGTAINFLSGTEENPTQLDAGKEKDPNQREAILDLIQSFCQGLSNQELGTMYLLLSEIEKDKAALKTILDLITQNQESQKILNNKIMQIFRKPKPRPTTIQICAADNVDARIITESLQKIADEFNATELHLMIKKLESFDTRLKIRAYLTVK